MSSQASMVTDLHKGVFQPNFAIWYLVPTPTKGGGGVEPTLPFGPETVDSTNFNFGRLLGLSMRGKKTGRGNDLSLVRFP